MPNPNVPPNDPFYLHLFSSMLFKLAVVVGLVAAGLYYALHVLPQPVYPVHTSGAVVITGASTGIGTSQPLGTACACICLQHWAYIGCLFHSRFHHALIMLPHCTS